MGTEHDLVKMLTTRAPDLATWAPYLTADIVRDAARKVGLEGVDRLNRTLAKLELFMAIPWAESCRRVRLNSGGYEPGRYGRYFGHGAPLYRIDASDGREAYIRAGDRAGALYAWLTGERYGRTSGATAP